MGLTRYPAGGGTPTLTQAVNTLLALTISSGESVKMDNRSLTGTLTYAGASLAGVIAICNDTTLTGFSAASTTSCAGTLTLTDNSALTTVNLSAMTSCVGMVNLTSTAIAAFTFALISCDGTFFFGANPITALDMSSLTNLAGAISFGSCASLADVTVAASIALADGFELHFQGCALPTADVDAVLAACNAGKGATTSGTITLNSGTNGIPTDGILNTDYVALVAAGITVSVNT